MAGYRFSKRFASCGSKGAPPSPATQQFPLQRSKWHTKVWVNISSVSMVFWIINMVVLGVFGFGGWVFGGCYGLFVFGVQSYGFWLYLAIVVVVCFFLCLFFCFVVCWIVMFC